MTYYIKVTVLPSKRVALIKWKDIEGLILPDTGPDKPGEIPRPRGYSLVMKSGNYVECERSDFLDKFVNKLENDQHAYHRIKSEIDRPDGRRGALEAIRNLVRLGRGKSDSR